MTRPSNASYRTPAPPSESARDERAERCPDADLVPVLGCFWLVSVARTFGEADAIGAAAWIVVIATPFLLHASLAWWARRARRALHSLFRR